MIASLEKLSEFVIYLSIIPFFMFPVQKWLKSSKKKLAIKIFIVFMCFFPIAFFIIDYLQITDTNTLMIPVFGYFFYFYNQEISLNIYKKAFWFFTTCLLGCFSALFSLMIDAYLHPYMTYYDFSMLRLLLQFAFIIIMNVILYYPVKTYYTWIFENYHYEKV